MVLPVLHFYIEFEREKQPLFPYIVWWVYTFKVTPKIRSSFVPLQSYILSDTYVEKADHVQDFITSDVSDYDESKDDFNINANMKL